MNLLAICVRAECRTGRKPLDLQRKRNCFDKSAGERQRASKSETHVVLLLWKQARCPIADKCECGIVRNRKHSFERLRTTGSIDGESDDVDAKGLCDKRCGVIGSIRDRTITAPLDSPDRPLLGRENGRIAIRCPDIDAQKPVTDRLSGLIDNANLERNRLSNAVGRLRNVESERPELPLGEVPSPPVRAPCKKQNCDKNCRLYPPFLRRKHPVSSSERGSHPGKIHGREYIQSRL